MDDSALDRCLDQVRFMTGLLDVSAMERRIAACLAFEKETLRVYLLALWPEADSYAAMT